MSVTQVLSEFNQAFSLKQQDVYDALAQTHNWESKYRNIMLLGKQLPSIEIEFQTDEALVQGCESRVWVYHSWQNNQLQLAAWSDAKIVKGLIAVVLSAYQGKSPEQIAQFDIQSYFEDLGLVQKLSPSRVNGIHAIVEQIKSY